MISRKWLILTTLAALLLLRPQTLSTNQKYRVEIQGVSNIWQKRALRQNSNLFRYRKTPPRSLAALRYRAEQDIPELIEVLHSYSFFDASINAQALRVRPHQTKMILHVDRGPSYLLKAVRLIPLYPHKEGEFELKSINLEELGIEINKPARTPQMEAAQTKLVSMMTASGYPEAKTLDPALIVDQAQKSVTLSVKVSSGPKGYFGKTNITQFKKNAIKESFIRNRIKWDSGELFNSEKILKTEKGLYDSGLFSVVSITQEELQPNGTVPMNIELKEAKTRNISIGGSYSTNWDNFTDRLGGSASWSTRNLLNWGIQLRLDYKVSRPKQNASIEFLFPDFLNPNQRLVLDSTVTIYSKMPAYDEHGVESSLYLERDLGDYLTTSLGIKFDQFKTKDSSRNDYFSLLGVPFYFNAQTAENMLNNPTKGGWVSLNLTPYFNLIDSGGNGFFEATVQGSIYQHLIPSKRLILAINAVFGTLFDSSTFNIPPPYRYFEGSPQHLRGYPYQKVSPLDSLGEEIGGRSKLLFSIEPRFMLFNSLEIVGFLDMGNVYTNSWPNTNTTLLKSLGCGVRFFSFIGPLRFDIGFPLNKTRNIKQNYQLYFSFGQAF